MTKAKQHAFYKALLKFIKGTETYKRYGVPSHGLCSEIWDYYKGAWDYGSFEDDFPILYSLRPEKMSGGIGLWFPYDEEGWEKDSGS